MVHTDPTIETDTREFFRELGITGDAALDALAAALGDDTCDIGSLKRVQHSVMHGCFTSRAELVRYLASELGLDEVDPAVVEFADLREFKEVATAVTAREHLDDVTDAQAESFVVVLGANTPEWFWPLVIRLAVDSKQYAFGAPDIFRRSLAEVFTVISRDIYDMFDVHMGNVRLLLEMSRLDLSDRKLPQEYYRWFIPVRADYYDEREEPGTEEF
jgi:hypothetical protein